MDFFLIQALFIFVSWKKARFLSDDGVVGHFDDDQEEGGLDASDVQEPVCAVLRLDPGDSFEFFGENLSDPFVQGFTVEVRTHFIFLVCCIPLPPTLVCVICSHFSLLMLFFTIIFIAIKAWVSVEPAHDSNPVAHIGEGDEFLSSCV